MHSHGLKMNKNKILTTISIIVIATAATYLLLAPAILEKSMNQVVAHEPYSITPEVQALHHSLLIGDWHGDSALWNRDLSAQHDYGHLDIPRMQSGNLALQMFTTVTKSPNGQNYQENQTDARDNITLLAISQLWPLKTWASLTERALYQAEKIQDLAINDSENFKLITTRDEVRQFLTLRKTQPRLVGGLLGTEGSHALDGNLDNIQRLFDHGFRMMSLQHFFDNRLGGSLHGTSKAGLTEFGERAVNQMISLGIIVDVSHSSEQVVSDVLAITDKPLVVSHTGFQGHCQSPRNISDSLMQGIAAKGGLIAVGFWEGAICGSAPKDIAAAISYGIGLVGEDHISLGSDFDGSVTTSVDGSELIAITQSLVDAGVTEAQIRKVMGENMLAFLEQNLP
jgi:microsomal dipeptidase-like Zn-dependent dipeptidase